VQPSRRPLTASLFHSGGPLPHDGSEEEMAEDDGSSHHGSDD